ncbi:MAG TPA: type II toxin-antitoxin system RelE/ParE family toxin [Usitatibacter sp.]|nr:type II toxin-antitoxin system RelE/ParE family toxin [Usitatibacter sp.]
MGAQFIELPAFERHRQRYLDDDQFRLLQVELMRDAECGDVIAATGGLRKMRFGDVRRGKGKRGGLRVIYYWREKEAQFWLFAVYDKDELEDLSSAEKKALKSMLDTELEARQ